MPDDNMPLRILDQAQLLNLSFKGMVSSRKNLLPFEASLRAKPGDSDLKCAILLFEYKTGASGATSIALSYKLIAPS